MPFPRSPIAPAGDGSIDLARQRRTLLEPERVEQLVDDHQFGALRVQAGKPLASSRASGPSIQRATSVRGESLANRGLHRQCYSSSSK
jgi:hypothetical protein